MSELSLESPHGGVSGSRSASQLSVLAETAYPQTVGSARVRVDSFIPFLRAYGVELTYRPALTDADYDVLASQRSIGRKAAVLSRACVRAALNRRLDHDVLLVHRLRLLNPLPGFDPPRRLDVYDIDDALFVPFTIGGVNRRFRWAKQEAKRCIQCLRRSKLVVAGNTFLADRARLYARRVEVVPSCVDPTRQPMHSHHDRREVTIGWIGSPTTSPYLRAVLPAIARLNSTYPRAKLVLVGADATIAAPWIEHRPWSLTTERGHLANFDIGIMPQPDDDWARGKCGYKVLQYFAAGVPAVGSAVGVTPRLIGKDRGVLAGTADQWYRALESLIEDPAQRKEQGAAARDFVERNYSYQHWAPELAQLLQSVAD